MGTRAHPIEIDSPVHRNVAEGTLECDESPQDLHRAYIELYKQETDEQIYQRLREMATELGRMPKKSEVPGAGYLKNRLGNWPRLMEKAGIKPVSPRRRQS